MPDREKVIAWLNEIVNTLGSFTDDSEQEVCQLAKDTLALLKEQEAEWVEDKQDEHCRLIKCSNCGLTFIVGNNIPYDEWIEDRNYCMRCGARMNGVKWE